MGKNELNFSLSCLIHCSTTQSYNSEANKKTFVWKYRTGVSVHVRLKEPPVWWTRATWTDVLFNMEEQKSRLLLDASHEVWFWHVCTFEKCGRSCNFMQLFSTCESHSAALGNVEESVLNQIGVKVLIWLCSTLLLWSAFVTNCKVQHLESINNLLLWVLFSFGFETLLT